MTFNVIKLAGDLAVLQAHARVVTSIVANRVCGEHTAQPHPAMSSIFVHQLHHTVDLVSHLSLVGTRLILLAWREVWSNGMSRSPTQYTSVFPRACADLVPTCALHCVQSPQVADLSGNDDAWWSQHDLTKLFVASNRLTEIADGVENLYLLTVLDAHDNAIATVGVLPHPLLVSTCLA